MKKTLLEKAQIAIVELNETTLLMRKQIESGEFDAPTVKKTMHAAMRKAKRIQSIAFYAGSTDEHFRQLDEFSDANLDAEIDSSIWRMNVALTLYAEAVGWTLLPAKKIRNVPPPVNTYFHAARKTMLSH
jgi:GTP cyclohydrolase III